MPRIVLQITAMESKQNTSELIMNLTVLLMNCTPLCCHK